MYKSFITRTAALLSLALFPALASAQTFTGPGFTITDNTQRVPATCSIVPVSGVTTNRIVRSVSFTGMTHTFIGDLELRVYPPGAAAPPSITGTGLISRSPTGRGCNYSGNYRFIDTATQSIDAATAGCTTATNLPAGDYRSSTNGGGTNPGTVTSVPALFGNLAPAAVNGNWRVCVFDFAGSDTGAVAGTSIEFVSPTAANVSLSGRVTDAYGRAISRTLVSLADSSGNMRTAITNTFGYYRFNDVPAGADYIISVTNGKRSFNPSSIVYSAVDNADDIDFVALP